MRYRRPKSLTFLLALLLAASSLLPTPGRAEAQMRCAGASPQSAPCARAEVPTGLTEDQVYGALMSCCRSPRGGCATMRGCPMTGRQASGTTHRAGLSARPCLVSIRAGIVPASPTMRRAVQPMTAVSIFAPPLPMSTGLFPARTTLPAFWTYSPALSPHAAPRLHGLRAPPAA